MVTRSVVEDDSVVPHRSVSSFDCDILTSLANVRVLDIFKDGIRVVAELSTIVTYHQPRTGQNNREGLP